MSLRPRRKVLSLSLFLAVSVCLFLSLCLCLTHTYSLSLSHPFFPSLLSNPFSVSGSLSLYPSLCLFVYDRFCSSSHDSSVLRAEIDGCIQMKSFLQGTPGLLFYFINQSTEIFILTVCLMLCCISVSIHHLAF